MLQTSTARSASASSRAKASISAREAPASRSSRSHSTDPSSAASASKPVVWAATKRSSTQPRSIIAFIAPLRKPTSPPTLRLKKRSAILVPNRALSRFEGTQ